MLALITARFAPVEPYDETTGLPQFWTVVSSTGKELRRYPGTAKAIADTFVTEFNVTAYEIHARLRDARSGQHRAE